MPRKKKHSILIVDDEPDVLFSLSSLLRRDFNVLTADSGAEALQIMNEHLVHVVMTDQRMPVMTGTELMQRVRQEHPGAIRIVFTGYADTRAIVDAINSGALFRYLTKPWDPDELTKVLHLAAEQYDTTAAQAGLLRNLESYLDAASRLAAVVDEETIGADFLKTFHARTEQFRKHVECVKVNSLGDREPALLIVLIEANSFRWNVAAVDNRGQVIPLLQSEEGDLDELEGLEIDAQVSFLRHRLAGALQRGCDRLHARQLRASRFVLIADGTFPNAASGVTQRLADHFVQWMINPPATFLLMADRFNAADNGDFNLNAGTLPQTVSTTLEETLPSIVSQLDQPEQWDLVPRPERS
jgi:CheY-like chemotaxis protein